MRIKPAPWIMPFMLFAIAITGGACFATSGVSVAAQPADTEAVTSEGAVDLKAESASSAAAEPVPAREDADVRPFSRIGIGVKVSTL
ncbi:MAG TPA: hypothetical protein VGI34_00095, partial [Candidatus Acidoferrales bacterium]